MFRVWLTVLILAVLVGSPLVADIRAETVEDLKRDLLERDRIITNLLQRMDALEREVRALHSAAVAAGATPGQPGPPLTASLKAGQDQPPSPPARAERDDEEERLARAALERTLIQRGGLLIPPWTLEVEPSFTYFHASSDRTSIDAFTILPFLAIGEIVSERVRRDSLQPAFTLRLGLPWDSQVEARVPYRYEIEQIVRADNEERDRDALGLGDVEVAVSKQLIREKGWIPDLLLSVRWKTTTGRGPFDVDDDELPLGTGFHGLQGTLTAVKVRDPVAFFGGISYTANLPEETRIGRVDPGDSLGFNLGLALALNPETSINFGWEQRFIHRTSVDDVNISGSYATVGIFRVGASYVLAPGMSLDFGLGIGLTRDAPDVQVGVALPIRFPR